ncbi:MAG: SagB/ThcOx family dehydrogenase [Candidatus Eisenbacteria bacterium]|nr:SagB/ThcOx family dehydrogenase [Candidatus Eisenbacteria bacterium]
MENMIQLPKASSEGGLPLWQTMAARRSVRGYSTEPMSLEVLSQLLWSTHGITGGFGGRELRNAPSAGACYPIDAHVVVNNVIGLSPGLYRYLEGDHALVLERRGDVGSELAAAALGQKMLRNASVAFAWTAVTSRTTARYGDRGLRYILLDAGHVGQNMYLAATSLGYGCCTVAAFDDDAANRVIGVDGKIETTIYLASVGPLE